MEDFDLGKAKDLTGMVVGKLTVLRPSHWHETPSGLRHVKWICKCSCGGESVVLAGNLNRGHTLSCGCDKKEARAKGWERLKRDGWHPTDLIGQKFGRLTVTAFAGWHQYTEDQRFSLWDCVCDCGNTHQMRRSYFTEESSCGCWRAEKISLSSSSHGKSKTRTYKSWLKMKERCYLDSYIETEYYQDKGITVCDRWLESFENFYEDMGERPEGKSLDRIDHQKGYSPDNCRWETPSVQSYNTGKYSNNTSGSTGVYLLDNGLYRAAIGYRGSSIPLGTNMSFEQACAAREAGEIKYYGFTKE